MPIVDYHVASTSDANEVIRLLAKVFSESEPPALAMGLSCAEMEEFLRIIVPQIVPCDLSIVARDRETQALAGVALSDDFASPPAFDSARISPKFLPIFAMLDRLDAQFRAETPSSPGHCIHLFMLAVEKRFAGRGIGSSLVQACIDNAREKDYRSAVTEATGRVSQHIFRKNGFTDRFTTSYADFLYDGHAPFASIRHHGAAILLYRSIF